MANKNTTDPTTEASMITNHSAPIPLSSAEKKVCKSFHYGMV
jgi:hypothetical protein